MLRVILLIWCIQLAMRERKKQRVKEHKKRKLELKAQRRENPTGPAAGGAGASNEPTADVVKGNGKVKAGGAAAKPVKSQVNQPATPLLRVTSSTGGMMVASSTRDPSAPPRDIDGDSAASLKDFSAWSELDLHPLVMRGIEALVSEPA